MSARSGMVSDTCVPPQRRWQLWALRPGLDGTSRPSTTLIGRTDPPGTSSGRPPLEVCSFQLPEVCSSVAI